MKRPRGNRFLSDRFEIWPLKFVALRRAKRYGFGVNIKCIAPFALLFFSSSLFAQSNVAPALQKGVVVSCPRDGRIWGEPIFEETLVEIKALGANAVQIHPYAWIGKDGSVKATKAAALGYLQRSVDMAKKQKVTMFMKPHLGYWGRFSWRGAITFDTPEKWARFFHDYEAWILDHARFAEKNKIPLLAVGTELEKMVHRPEWPGFIKKVRQVY